jgi:hypothetical protein
MKPIPTPLNATAQMILNKTLLKHEAPFDAVSPSAFFFKMDGTIIEVCEDSNPYACLFKIGETPFPLEAAGIGLMNGGWVAPTSNQPPSESPDRKRVVFVMVLNRLFERECAMEIEESPGLLEGVGSGEGPLAEALEEALTRSFWNRLSEFD